MAANILSTSIKKNSRVDNLAAVDVYGTTNPDSAINNIIPKSVSKLITPKNSQSSILAEIKAAASQGTTVDKLTSINDIYTRVEDVLEGSKTGLNSLPQNKLKSMLGLLNLEDTTLGKLTVGGVEFRNLKNKNAKSTMKLIESLLGDDTIAEYFDGNSMFALLKTGIEMAQELGVPDLVQKLLDKAADNRLKVKLMTETLPSAVRSSDMAAVKRILDELGVGKCFTIMPDIIESIFQFYRIPSNNKKTVDELRSQVLAILDKLDSNWDKGTMNGVEVYSIERMFNVSEDFISIWPSIDVVDVDMYEPNGNPQDSWTAAQKRYSKRCQLLSHARKVRKVTAYQLIRQSYPKGRFIGQQGTN